MYARNERQELNTASATWKDIKFAKLSKTLNILRIQPDLRNSPKISCN